MLLALPATSGADRVGSLRSARSALAARAQAALLQLYSLNTSLDQARSRLAGVDAALAAARRDRGGARLQFRVAERSLRIAQARLGEQVRAQYEQDSPDALAVIFGAASLDEIITGLDSLNRATSSTNDVIEQLTQARHEVSHVLGSLNRKAARLARLRAGAAARADELARAQAERSSYIGELRTRERLTGERIAQLEAQARTAEATSTVATVKAQTAASLSSLGSAVAPSATPPPPPPPAPPQRPRRSSPPPAPGSSSRSWPPPTLSTVALQADSRPGPASSPWTRRSFRSARGWRFPATAPASPPTPGRRSRASGSTCGSRR